MPEYVDERGGWEAALPSLNALREQTGIAAMTRESGLVERELRDVLSGRRMPHRAARARLTQLLDTPRP